MVQGQVVVVVLVSMVESSILHLHHHQPDQPEGRNKLFLGDELDRMKPEEVRARLGELAQAMDRDGDGEITVEELTEWIRRRQEEQVRRRRSRWSRRWGGKGNFPNLLVWGHNQGLIRIWCLTLVFQQR